MHFRARRKPSHPSACDAACLVFGAQVVHFESKMARTTVLSVVSVLALFLYCTNALTIKVEPKAEECFYEYLEQTQQTELTYNVVDGGLLDIELRVRLYHLMLSLVRSTLFLANYFCASLLLQLVFAHQPFGVVFSRFR